MAKLTHVDEQGKALMVDVSNKEKTERIAIASGFIKLSKECLKSIVENTNKKGDVLAVARVAGIMAAKKNSELIPLCHNIALTNVKIDFDKLEDGYLVTSTVKCVDVTGVEMEALTAASVALLTIYDMCKAIDKRMVISDIHLVEKRGGKSGDFKY